MMVTTIVMNVFAESIKDTIFYLFNLLSRSAADDKSNIDTTLESNYDDPQVQDDETTSDPHQNGRQYSLRERKSINYKV
jgi:hypothetical protein